VYVLIVLIVLTLAIPLAQAVNFFVGIAYDVTILIVAASQQAAANDAPPVVVDRAKVQPESKTQTPRELPNKDVPATQRDVDLGGGGAPVFSRRNAQSSINPFETSAQSGIFGSFANRAQRWMGGRRAHYGEVSPASEDDESGSETVTMHHVFDVGAREKMATTRLGGSVV